MYALSIATLQMEQSVTGFVGQGSVTLTCEVSNYASFLGSPMWINSNGTSITEDSSKYLVSTRSGSNRLIYDNGTTGPSLVSTLTILQLSVRDEGNYTCSVNSVTLSAMNVFAELSVMEGTSPTSTLTPPSTTTPPSTITTSTITTTGMGSPEGI